MFARACCVPICSRMLYRPVVSRVLRLSSNSSGSLEALSSLSDAEIGPSILLTRKDLPPGSTKTAHEMIASGVFTAKVLSLASSAAGAAMVPILSSYLWEAAQERPATMAFAIVANGFLVLLSFTPFLLHTLAKRFPIDVRYNKAKNVVTTIHYDFILRKRALQFAPNEVVDAAVAPELKKVWIPLATCFVKGRPLLLSLDERQYSDVTAFREITKNINIPLNHD